MQDRFKIRYFNKNTKKFEYYTVGTINTNPFTDCTIYENGQFCTGLKDKKGKLIYEGDILKIDNPFEESKKILMPVKWTTNLQNTGFSFNQDFANNTGVIGNIYENKELINANIQS